MKCKNHPKKNATGACVSCGNLFCSDCLLKVKKKNYCKDCAKSILEGNDSSKKEDKIVFSQQQQQQQTSNEVQTEPTSLKVVLKWLISLIVILMSLAYFGMGSYVAAIVCFLLGVYWLPPILDKTQELLNEKYGKTAPLWLRIVVSIVLFIIIIPLLGLIR